VLAHTSALTASDFDVRILPTFPELVVDILEAPENVTVGLGSDPLTLTCRVRGERIFIRINGEVYSHGTHGKLLDSGITVTHASWSANGITQNVTVELTERNNNTNIICIAVVQNPRCEILSNPAFIFIAGTSDQPSVRLSIRALYPDNTC
jgi:hypothetical protein